VDTLRLAWRHRHSQRDAHSLLLCRRRRRTAHPTQTSSKTPRTQQQYHTSLL
jgi:hypothetical protein